MPIEPKMLKWLNVLADGNLDEAVAQADIKRRARSAVSAKLVDGLNSGDNMTLFTGFNQQVTDGKRKQKMLQYVNRDQTEEFDLDEVNDGYRLMDQEDGLDLIAEALNMAEAYVAEITKPLPELDDAGKPVMTDDGKGNMVPKFVTFTEEELTEMVTEEVYEPLKRRGLLPETFIPDKYSKSKKMIQGAFGAYEKRVRQEEKKGFQKFLHYVGENKGLGISVLSGAGSFASSAFKAEGLKDLGKDPSKDFVNKFAQMKDLKGAGTRFVESFTDVNKDAKAEGIGAELAGFGLDCLTKLDDARQDTEGLRDGARDKLGNLIDPDPPAVKEAKELRRKAAGKVAEFALTEAAGALAGVLEKANLGTVVSTAFRQHAKTAPLVKALSEVPALPVNIEKALTGIANAYVAALADCVPDAPTGTTKATLDAAGAAMAAKFKTDASGRAGAIAGWLPENFDDTKFDEIYTLLTKAGAAAAAAGNTPALGNLLNDTAAVDAVRDKVGKAVEAEMSRELDEEERKDKEEEELINQKAGKEQALLIEKRIFKLKAEQQLLKWSTGLAGMGFDLASKALAPLALGGSLVKIANSLLQAVRRMRDMIAFVQSKQDMLRAASAYSAPVANFIDNAAIQYMHYSITCAIEVIKFIGIICECTGVPYAVAAGKAVQIVATVAAATEQILYEMNKRINLEVAWQSYKKALLRPDNRKLALIAMKKNPTLAKYAVAWGCVVDGDPLVADFMRSTGLSDRDMQEDGVGTDKVVEYLETRFPDDNVVVGRAFPMAEWAPKPPELTATFFVTLKARAVEKADLVEGLDSKALEVALVNYEETYTAFAALLPQTPQDPKPPGLSAAAEACQTRLDKVSNLLALAGNSAYRKAKPKNLPHTEFVEAVGNLKELSVKVAADLKPHLRPPPPKRPPPKPPGN